MSLRLLVPVPPPVLIAFAPCCSEDFWHGIFILPEGKPDVLVLTAMNDLLSQLKQFSVIVADTGDFDSIRKYQPRDTTTNPSLLLKAAQMPEYAALVEKALADAKKESTNASHTLGTALDKLAVAFGLEILNIVPGRVS